MNRPIFIAGTACAALFICVALRAADDNKSNSAPSTNSASDNNAALFDRLDANHDGQITTDEVPAEHRALFERLLRRADRNGDGKLSREEFMSGLADDQPGRPADRPAGMGASAASSQDSEAKIRGYAASIMKQFDTNGDGVLDKSEWSKLPNAEKYDLNHDGKITLEEIIETLRPAQRAADEQDAMPRERGPMGSGGFGMGGMRGGAAMAGGGVGPFMGAALFRALDINNDGKLDAKEIAAAADVLKKLANSNGEITREELLNSLPPGAGPGGGAGGIGGRAGLRGLLGGGQGGANPDRPQLNFDQIVKMLDKNGDGKLQKEELPPFLQDRFEQLDTNHDGVLDESELKQILPRLANQLQQRAEGRQGGDRPQRRPMPPDQNKSDGN
jgi:Ca2+-binding EF-hand superfamily protein